MTKIIDEFNNLPFTRRELLKQVQSQVNRPIIALFWTGSRINNLARPDSDYDVIAITNVTNEDLLNFNHYRETVKSKLYNKDLEIKVIDIISLYQSLSKSNWILLEALSQQSISTDQYFQPLFATLSDSNWLISSCPSRYAKAAIGQSLSILTRIRHNHPRWRHDIYYIVIQPKGLNRVTITTIQLARKNNKQQKLMPQIPVATQETFLFCPLNSPRSLIWFPI